MIVSIDCRPLDRLDDIVRIHSFVAKRRSRFLALLAGTEASVSKMMVHESVTCTCRLEVGRRESRRSRVGHPLSEVFGPLEKIELYGRSIVVGLGSRSS
jgi:hypothetical protein